MFLTRRKTLAVRDEIHMGEWKAAYMYDDYTIVYHRAWDYGDFTPVRGEHRRSREEVRLNVTTTFCLRCAEMTPNGMHLCPGCALPVFYPNFIPNAEEKDFERCRIVPEWVRTMGQFKPKRIPTEVVGVIKRNLISYSMASDLRMTVQSGIRLPPYLGEDKGGVDAAWDELARVLFQFSYVLGRGSRHRMRSWRSGRMTTSVRKFARHDTYLSFYIPMAYVIGSAAGHLTPLYPTHRKDVDILKSHALISQLRQYMVSETGYDEKRRLKEAIAKVQKAISAGQSEPPAPFRDPFVYVSDERVRTVIDGSQPEPLNVDIVRRVLVPSRSRSSRAEKEKGRKGKRAARAVVLPAHRRSQVKCQIKDLVRAVAHLSLRQRQRMTLDQLRWRLMRQRPSRRRLGPR